MTDFDQQLEKMLDKQKIARVNNEHFTSVTILKQIITLCYNTKRWQKLRQMINYLMNRRGQGKKAQIEMIQLLMTWLPKTEEPQRTELIQTIRDVCSKKIFLQVEYARCVLLIVKSKQNENDILQAANILQEVQVETYGSMDRRQKLEFILYQMKIMIKKSDYVRLFIISKKINENNINDDQIADIKINYYSYLSMYYNHENNYNECTRCYKIMYETLKVTKKIIPDELDFGFSSNIHNVLSNYIGFLSLQTWTPANEEQLKKLQADETLERNPQFLHLINNLLLQEIVTCDIAVYHTDKFELFRDGYENASVHRKQLHRVLVQHNIRIIAKYYGRLTLKRISELIKVDKDFCEEQLCYLNNEHLITCRVDRIDDTVDFRPVENQNFLLVRWNESVNSILDMVDVVSNLIHREREVYKK